MTPEQLKSLTDLVASYTEKNNHTEARIAIAEAFPYLEKWAEILKAVKKIEDIDGHIHHFLSQYRAVKTGEILQVIEDKEGIETAQAIYQAL